MDKRQAAAHLEYYGELGVAGWSLDREWRRRAGGPEPTQDGEIAAGGSMEADPADGTPVGGEGVVSLEAVQTELGECTR